jgi:hypothetical protein
MSNPFTQESRDARLSLGLAGFIDKLRAPDSLHALVMLAKPATVPASDFALKSMLDQHLMALIVRSDYRGVYVTLGTLFGPEVTAGTRGPRGAAAVTDGTNGAKRYAREEE